MTSPNESREELRRNALTAFLDERVGEGFRVETRTGTHAIIAPVKRPWSFLVDRFRNAESSGRQVIAVDEHGAVTMSPAEPLRS